MIFKKAVLITAVVFFIGKLCLPEFDNNEVLGSGIIVACSTIKRCEALGKNWKKNKTQSV